MEYDLQLIGARLQAARKAKGYTQDYVSARADITEKFLSQIERGKAGLSVQTLIALCDIFYLKVVGQAAVLQKIKFGRVHGAEIQRDAENVR